MRITSNMLIQQLVQAAKNEGSQKPEIGAAINARVSEVLNGILTLDMGDGNRMTARDLSGQKFYPGQAVTFEVVGVDSGGTLQIRPSGDKPETDLNTISQMLKKLNLPDTDGNRELLRTLSVYRIPLTSENIRTAQALTMHAKGIIQLTDQTGTDVLEDQESVSLKQIATRLVEISGLQEKTGQAGIAGRTAGSTASTSPPALPGSVDGLLKTGAVQANGVAPEERVRSDPENQNTPKMSALPILESKAGSDVMKQTGVRSQESEADLIISPKAGDAENAEISRGSELKELLKQLTFEKIGFIIKNQLPNDLGTLNALDKLITGKKELGIQLDELLNKLPGDQTSAALREAIQTAGKAVHISPDMNPFDFQKQVKALNSTLTQVSLQIAETVSGNQGIKESLAEVKNSLDFLGRLSESATYLHVPVALGQGTKPMDLYVQRDKSGQKKVNPRDTKIFISLDTHHMETVQCLLAINGKKLDIGFKVADADILELITPVFEPLKESLNKLGYADIMVHGMVYERPLNLMDVTQEPASDLRQIDMRV